MILDIIDMGRVPYEKALAYQKFIMAEVIEGVRGDTLLLVEHDPVITMGKRAEEDHILADKALLNQQGIKVVKVERGGDVTYHGPGQLVGYPIIRLRSNKLKIRRYIEGLMEVLVQVTRIMVESSNLHTEEGHYTGVWVGNDKISAIGVEVKRGVTMHGFAFNINTNLDHFKWIVPCGLEERGVTSLKALLGEEQDYVAVKKLVIKKFCEVFQVEGEGYGKKTGVD